MHCSITSTIATSTAIVPSSRPSASASNCSKQKKQAVLLWRAAIFVLESRVSSFDHPRRKALHLPTQSFASAHAKLCNHTYKRLLEKAPSFRSHPHVFSTEPFWDCSYARGNFSLLLINGTLLIVEPSFHQLYTTVCVDQELLSWVEPSGACRQGCIWHEEPRRNGRWP